MSNPHEPAWWTSAVVYQIYPRSFADGSGDGIGDLKGILAHLDYLQELGVDVVWLSPVHESPQRDNGYDISNYRRIDRLFGTEEDFDELLGAMHVRGMKLVMDLVVNHTSSEHPVFEQARQSRKNPYRDYFWWRDARPGFEPGEPGAEPNNWRSFFGGPAWTFDPGTGQYYLHLFTPHQPDLNWENPLVRQEVYDTMRWWLDRGVDGFRMDVINLISKDPALPDGLVEPGSIWGDGAPHFTDGPRIHEFLQEMRRTVFGGRDGDFLTVGETPGTTVEQALLYTDPYRAEVDMVFQFEHVNVDQIGGRKWNYRPLSLPDLKTSWNRWQRGLADRGWNSLYLSNHDQPRHVSRFGNDGDFRYESATLWATLLHLQRGTPYVYQGEEIGMTNAGFTSIAQYQDVESLNFYAEATAQGMHPGEALEALRAMSRDNARTPMQWTAGANAGFTAGEPWLQVNPNYSVINADADRTAEKSVFRFYQDLIRLRHTEDVVALGDFHLEAPDHPHLFAFRRRFEETSWLILANVSSGDLPLPAGLAVSGDLVLGNYAEPGGPEMLRPWEARILNLSAAAPGGVG